MLSVWAVLSEKDVETYASGLVLPSYLAYLRLEPFHLAAQAPNREGREPLKLVYAGQGRVEDYFLTPEEHATAMIESVCPGLDVSAIRVPEDDATWSWAAGGEGGPSLRIYFSPSTSALGIEGDPPSAEEAYVSLSRGHVFLGRAMVEAYVEAWLGHLKIAADAVRFEFSRASAGVDFTSDHFGGQLLLDDEAMINDLLQFVGLRESLRSVCEFAPGGCKPGLAEGCEIGEQGLHLTLSVQAEA